MSEDFSLLAPCRANDAEVQEELKDADHFWRAIGGGIEQMRAHQPCVRSVVKLIAMLGNDGANVKLGASSRARL